MKFHTIHFLCFFVPYIHSASNRTVSGPVFADDQTLEMFIQTPLGLKSAKIGSPSLPEIECIITSLNRSLKQLYSEQSTEIIEQRKIQVTAHLKTWIRKEFLQYNSDRELKLEISQIRDWIATEHADLIKNLATRRSYALIDEALIHYTFVLSPRVSRNIGNFASSSDIAALLRQFQSDIDRAVFFWNFRLKDVHGKRLKIFFNANMTDWSTRFVYETKRTAPVDLEDGKLKDTKEAGLWQRLRAAVNRKSADG